MGSLQVSVFPSKDHWKEFVTSLLRPERKYFVVSKEHLHRSPFAVADKLSYNFEKMNG